MQATPTLYRRRNVSARMACRAAWVLSPAAKSLGLSVLCVHYAAAGVRTTVRPQCGVTKELPDVHCFSHWAVQHLGCVDMLCFCRHSRVTFKLSLCHRGCLLLTSACVTTHLMFCLPAARPPPPASGSLRVRSAGVRDAGRRSPRTDAGERSPCPDTPRVTAARV